MKKQQKKKSKLEELDERHREINRKIVQAYSAGMNQNIIRQLEYMLEEVKLQMYDESELQKNRDDEDGESFIV